MFMASIEETINEQLRQIRGGTDTVAFFATDVRCLRHADIEFSAATHRSPDSQYQHHDAMYPGLIVEAAVSEKVKDLTHLAEDYILESEGDISVVLCVDLEYGKRSGQGSRKATLSVWRPQIDGIDNQRILRAVQVVKDELFRDDQGNPTGCGLKFSLSEFTYSDLADELLGGTDKDIVISSLSLCEFLADAEEFHKKRERMRITGEGRRKLAPVIKMYRRPRSPPKELSAKNEEAIA